MDEKEIKQERIKVILGAVIFIAAICLFSLGGKQEFKTTDTGFTVHTAVWKDLSVNYEDIDKAEIREDIKRGKRVAGYGTDKASIGNYRNDEFGDYKLYALGGCNTLVCLHMKDGSVVVIGGIDEAASADMYVEIVSHLKQ